MCKSDPSRSTTIFSSSGSVGIGSLHGFAHDFFDGRDALFYFSETRLTKSDHSLVNRLAPELESRSTDQHQFLQLLGHFHHFIQAYSALVTGLVALLAATAFHRRDRVGVFGREAGLQKCGRGVRLRLFTVRADAPDETLCANQVHRARYQK